MFGLRSKDIDLIVEVLQRHPDVEEAIIFGSRAMGNHKPGSDVDVALKGNLNSDTSTDIAVELNERMPLPYKFDIIAYHTISHKPFIDHIDRYGKILYKK
ncbi:MAG: nucleotidyltransferase domain-containing protein [Chlamydiae bacterium]|nr:nucleotidyltransferase domain-containing protein [Chlamydiota bacterium]